MRNNVDFGLYIWLTIYGIRSPFWFLPSAERCLTAKARGAQRFAKGTTLFEAYLLSPGFHEIAGGKGGLNHFASGKMV
jgi:hypothetical protein